MHDYKKGNCARCPKIDTPCVKRGREYLCLFCAQLESQKKYVATARNKPRQMLTRSIPLSRWYGMTSSIIDLHPYCDNCGAFISSALYWAATAHIFPKEHFPSVKTHPFNFIILGPGCGCHSRFDISIASACKMPVWEKAVDKYQHFKDSITENHSYKTLFEEAS